jgi:hypothetical protein
MICGVETWDVSRKNRNKLLTTEMDCYEGAAREED